MTRWIPFLLLPKVMLTDLIDLAADVDGNGDITAEDARKLLRVSSQLETLD